MAADMAAFEKWDSDGFTVLKYHCQILRAHWGLRKTTSILRAWCEFSDRGLDDDGSEDAILRKRYTLIG